MAKRRFRNWDMKLTDQLGLDELYVESYNNTEDCYIVCNQDPLPECCPACGCTVLKVHDQFEKNYLDILEDARIINLRYRFYKYRCTADACGLVFPKEIHFGSQMGRVTHRMEDDIAERVIRGDSYGTIATAYENRLTRQAVGQIFNRWVEQKEEQLQLQCSIQKLAIISSNSEQCDCTLFLNLDGDVIQITDIQYGVNSAEIAAVLRRPQYAEAEIVITDCNPTIVDTVNDYLPFATHITPVGYWFRAVTEDFSTMAHEILKWSPVLGKEEIILQEQGMLGYRQSNLNQLFETRPDILQPYRDYHELRELLQTRDASWTYKNIVDWTTTLCPPMKEQLGATMVLLDRNKEGIHQHELHMDAVPVTLIAQTKNLIDELAKMKTFSAEVLRARVLFSITADPDTPWTGNSITEIINKLAIINKTNGGKKHAYD